MDKYKDQRGRGEAMHAKLAKAFPKITWTYAWDKTHWTHNYTGAFDLMDDVGTFHLNISDEMIDVYSFEEEITYRVAHSLAHEITASLLEGAARWKAA